MHRDAPGCHRFLKFCGFYPFCTSRAYNIERSPLRLSEFTFRNVVPFWSKNWLHTGYLIFDFFDFDFMTRDSLDKLQNIGCIVNTFGVSSSFE